MIVDKKFDLTLFNSYNTVPSQYSDTYIKNSCSVVVEEDEKRIIIACSERTFLNVKKNVRQFHPNKKIELIKINNSDFQQFIGNIIEVNAVKEIKNIEKKEYNYSLEEVSETSPVVNIINATCLNAIQIGASDIHIVPENKKTVIRFRIDGVLKNIKEFDLSIFNSISSRIKVMSNLNIMEQRLCQDGHMKLQTEKKEYDFRVSIVPVIGGESIVLRLFNSNTQKADIDELGFSKNNLKLLRESVNISNGLILISGPTGSGKTTTIHSLINLMNKEALKIITIEDPVERIIDDVEQIQINESIGLTFESVLRSVLRQDPDVIMVGEIRDCETAELAIRASLTGHIIISTLHTNDSISSITRLINLGIEPYLISSVFKYSIAQRLVRKLCPYCKKKSNSRSSVYIAKGCDKCNFTGFKGRTVVSEVFRIDENISEMILQKKKFSEIKEYLQNNKMKFLSEDALLKVKNGETATEELKREALI